MIYKYYLELKNRFILLSITWCFTIFISYIYKEIILFILIKPSLLNYKNIFYFIFTDIREIFSMYFNLCVFISNQILIFFLVIQCFNFVSTGLYYFEYKYLKKIFIIYFGFWIFLLNCLNKFLLPVSSNFFLSFQNFISFTSLTLHFEAKIIEYLNFYYLFYYICLFYCQLIIFVIIFLNYINFNLILIKKYRKIFYFFICLFSTLLTPPDVISQIIFSIGLILIYELLIFTNLIKLFNFYKTT